MNVTHNIEPFFEPNSRVLLLGSMPSVASRAAGFFYAHPQNRMWRVLAEIYSEAVPSTEAEKRELLSSHNLAMWDVLQSCEIEGSMDSSIKSAVPNDISRILNTGDIRAIFTTGGAAEKYYRRLVYPTTLLPSRPLPSTSAANARMSLEALVEHYREILQFSK